MKPFTEATQPCKMDTESVCRISTRRVAAALLVHPRVMTQSLRS